MRNHTTEKTLQGACDDDDHRAFLNGTFGRCALARRQICPDGLDKPAKRVRDCATNPRDHKWRVTKLQSARIFEVAFGVLARDNCLV